MFTKLLQFSNCAANFCAVFFERDKTAEILCPSKRFISLANAFAIPPVPIIPHLKSLLFLSIFHFLIGYILKSFSSKYLIRFGIVISIFSLSDCGILLDLYLIAR